MSEKVKLTREQAEAIEKCASKENLIKSKLVGLLEHGKDEPIAELTLETLAKALYIGYEVEETFEVGDWVFDRDSIYKIISKHHADDLNKGVYSKARHATAEEIAEEKQRRWWEKHGRKVWELRRNDLVSDKDGCSYTINLIKKDYVEFVEFGMRKKVKEIKESFKVICFAEDRKDINGGDNE